MLSIENPPPDPPCPCEISQLKSSDERASDRLALQDVDLFRSSVDDTKLAKFSIRDYVFTARSKDIKTNWPFSSRNLQLCLKHGVKDPLPPFQSLDSLRNRSLKTCPVETSLVDQDNIISHSDGEPSGRSNHLLPSSSDDAPWNQTPAAAAAAAAHKGLNSCQSGGHTDFPSTTTTNSQSEIQSVPPNRISTSPIETVTSLEASVELLQAEAEAVGRPPASHKTENITQPSSKKCRLIVKWSSVSDPSSTEDIASNCTTLSEAMTSKICPVCKTFSSSSNTTLNAHIDQCLSVESTSKWMSDSKLTTKYRIKPRKMRSMVDICETAPRCTLEELDRRNGSSWAVDSSLPTQDTGLCAQGKRQRVSPIYPDHTGDEGAVYIDANGTKLRILSKFNGASSVSMMGEEDPGPRKPLKGGKRSKFFSTNKKKYQKYLKLAPQSKKNCSSKAHNSEIHGGQDGNYGVEESRKEEHLTHLFKAQGQNKTSESRTLRQWVCSKRTGLSKKINTRQLSGFKLHVPQDLLVESDRSCLGDSHMERNCAREFLDSSEKPISSPECHKRMGSSSYGTIKGNKKQSHGRKRVRSPLFTARRSDNVESSPEPSKQNSFQLSKDSTSVHDNCMLTHPHCMSNHASLPSNKTVEIHTGPVKNSDASPDTSTNLSCHALSSKAMRFSTLRKNGLSVNRLSLPESNVNVKKKCLTLKKSQVHCMEEMDEEVAAWPSDMDEQYDLMHNHTENQSGIEEIIHKVSLGRGCAQKIWQDRGALSVFRTEETMALKCSQVAARCHGHNVGEKTGSSVRVSGVFSGKSDGLESARKEVQFQGEGIVIERSSDIAAGGTIMRLMRSIDPEFHKLDNSSGTQSDSLPSFDEFEGPLCVAESPAGPTEPSVDCGQQMFCVDEAGSGVIGQKIHMGAELDSKVGQGNSFLEIDPIPIPGPPGSFLPSPGDMSSEDFQGNSSLTTSRVHSSQDQHDLVDGDSSDSLISATSSISNSGAARTDLKHPEQSLSAGPHAVQDKIGSGFLGAGIEPVVENAATVTQAVSMGANRINLDGENLKVNVLSPEKGTLKFKDDDQPCCCSRKERISHGVSLNYQESQLLRRRAMSSVTLPTMGKQMGCNLNTRPNNLNARTEMFSLSSFQSSGSEKMILPVMKSPAGPIAMKGSSDAAVKFPSHGDSESSSPSASNPILRLMGKNLMVVNKDEDSSMHHRGGALSNCPNAQFLNHSGVSHANIQSQDYHSFHHMVPQASVNFGQDSHKMTGQCFDVRFSNSFRGQISSMTPETPTQAQVGILPRACSGLAASLELHENKGEYNLPTQLSRPKNRLDAASTYSIAKVIRTPDPKCRNADSAGNPIKEIIIIDDAPESEADSTTDDAKYTKGLRGSQDPSPLGELPIVNGSFHAPHSRPANTSPFKWSCTSDGSGVLQRGRPLMASSASTSHLQSALYYSPTLS